MRGNGVSSWRGDETMGAAASYEMTVTQVGLAAFTRKYYYYLLRRPICLTPAHHDIYELNSFHPISDTDTATHYK